MLVFHSTHEGDGFTPCKDRPVWDVYGQSHDRRVTEDKYGTQVTSHGILFTTTEYPPPFYRDRKGIVVMDVSECNPETGQWEDYAEIVIHGDNIDNVKVLGIIPSDEWAEWVPVVRELQQEVR